MASTLSVSLRETARLYLRYMTVGLVSIPLAVLYAWAKRANWNTVAVLAGLLLLGLVSAFFTWRRMGAWQVKPAVAPNFEASWVELINATLRNGAPFQQTVTIDAERLRTWNNFLVAFAASPDTERLKDSWTQILEAQMRAAQPTETLQYFLSHRKVPLPRNPPHHPNVRPEPSRQREPAWASALSGQMPEAHGLA